MDRVIDQELQRWRKAELRYPLLLRGARQVGKTYAVEKLGASFPSFEAINFEAQPEAIACFETLDPQRIVQKLELLVRRPIRPGATLLFLDEIQACPQAIVALRYFKEKMPDLPVIGAGSLLEFTLRKGKFSFPVGRVQFMYLRPFSFYEFCLGLKEDRAMRDLEQATIDHPPSEELHRLCMQRIQEYFLIGGMPAVVNDFQQSRSFLQPGRIQDILLATYRADFNKYASEAEQKYLRLLFDRLPHQIGKLLKYSEINPDVKSRELKGAFEQLEQAGLVHSIYASSASGLPLAAQIKYKKFKSLFIDIGLLQRSLQVNPELVLQQEDLLQIHKGALAEQFVGQELLACADFFREESLFYWEREKKGSSAEIDYVISIGQEIIPIEVKAGAQGHLKSLRQFMEEKKSRLGIRISQNPLSYQKEVLSIPFYMIKHIPRLVALSLSR